MVIQLFWHYGLGNNTNTFFYSQLQTFQKCSHLASNISHIDLHWRKKWNYFNFYPSVSTFLNRIEFTASSQVLQYVISTGMSYNGGTNYWLGMLMQYWFINRQYANRRAESSDAMFRVCKEVACNMVMGFQVQIGKTRSIQGNGLLIQL